MMARIMRIFEAPNSKASTMAIDGIDVLDCAGEAEANVSDLASTSTMADPC